LDPALRKVENQNIIDQEIVSTLSKIAQRNNTSTVAENPTKNLTKTNMDKTLSLCIQQNKRQNG
jgi:hypothetical protein